MSNILWLLGAAGAVNLVGDPEAAALVATEMLQVLQLLLDRQLQLLLAVVALLV
jgi:hypothetical protein